MSGVSGFGPRVHYQKPRSVNDFQGGFKWARGGQAGPSPDDEDEMPPLKAPAAPAPSVPSPARAEKRPLVEGSKVRVDGLTGAKHLNGSVGTLVAKEDGRFLVELSSGPEAGSIKAMKPQNVTLEADSRTTSSSPAANSSRPTSAPTPARAETRPGLEVGARIRLVGLETRPELNNASGVVVAVQASRYHIRLDAGGDKLMKAKNVERIPGSAAPAAPAKATVPASPTPSPKAKATPSPAAAASAAPPSVASAPAQPRPRPQTAPTPATPIRPPPKLRDVLQAAKPSWTEKDLSNVVEKLSKAKVSTFEHLRDSLRSTGAASLNERLRSAGQKIFATDTIAALKQRVDLEEPPKPQIERNPQNLPVQRWEVVNDLAMVREKPSLAARALARKDRGEVVQSAEETFDGFLKLHGEEGWCAKDCQGKLGLGVLLRRLPGQPELILAADAPAPGPGPQPFKVIFSPSVAVRAAPSTDANIISARRLGEVVLAETQTYSGWLRLEGDGGWMLSRHPQHGVLLQPAFDKERPQEDQAEGVASMDQVVQETLERHRASQASDVHRPVSQANRSAAEAQQADQRRAAEAQKSLELEAKRRQEEEKRRKQAEEEQRRRQEEARRVQEEQERRRQREEEARRAKEAEEAKVAAVQLAAEQERLLDAFAEAAASGDPGRIKVARDAAKKGGVPTKEIARVFALAQQAAE